MTNELSNIPQGNGLAIVSALNDIQRVARMAIASKLFLSNEPGTPEEKLAKASLQIITGMEMGVGPVEAMRNIVIIKGKPTFSAGFMASRIKSSGRYNYRVKTSTDTECAIQFFEGGEPCGESRYTIAEARKAGLVKSGGAWESYPSDMLFARALSRGARRFCPDIFAGSAYTPEELGGSPRASVRDVEYTEQPASNDNGYEAAHPDDNGSPEPADDGGFFPPEDEPTVAEIAPVATSTNSGYKPRNSGRAF